MAFYVPFGGLDVSSKAKVWRRSRGLSDGDIRILRHRAKNSLQIRCEAHHGFGIEESRCVLDGCNEMACPLGGLEGEVELGNAGVEPEWLLYGLPEGELFGRPRSA